MLKPVTDNIRISSTIHGEDSQGNSVEIAAPTIQIRQDGIMPTPQTVILDEPEEAIAVATQLLKWAKAKTGDRPIIDQQAMEIQGEAVKHDNPKHWNEVFDRRLNELGAELSSKEWGLVWSEMAAILKSESISKDELTSHFCKIAASIGSEAAIAPTINSKQFPNWGKEGKEMASDGTLDNGTWWTKVGSYSEIRVGDTCRTENYYGDKPKITQAIAERFEDGKRYVQWKEVGWRPDEVYLTVFDITEEKIDVNALWGDRTSSPT